MWQKGALVWPFSAKPSGFNDILAAASTKQPSFLNTYLEMGLLQDPGQLGGAVVFDLQAADVPQDLRHQLHVVVLHRLQLDFLRLLMSLGVRRGRG